MPGFAVIPRSQKRPSSLCSEDQRASFLQPTPSITRCPPPNKASRHILPAPPPPTSFQLLECAIFRGRGTKPPGSLGLSPSLFPPSLSRDSMSNRASSTPFQAGPPSPSSPATGLQKGNHSLFVPSDQIPQSPTSPLMSVSTQNYASNFTTSQPSPHQAISQPTNLSSPPSSAPMSTQVSQQPTVGTANSFPTPASSVSGHFMASTSADDPDHMDKSFGAMEREATSAPIEKAASTHPMEYEHRRTDHHRDAGTISSPAKELGQQKTTVDAMDIDVGASRSLDDDTLGSLEGFTSAFHLCRRCKSSPETNLCCSCGPIRIAIC